MRCVQRRLSPVEVEALIADYEAGGRVGELATVYGIHRTTVSAHVAVSVGLDEGEGVHVEVVAGFLAERCPGGHELVDEGSIDPRGVEDR